MVWVAVKKKFGLCYFIPDKKNDILKRNDRSCSQDTTSLPGTWALVTFQFATKFWTKCSCISVSSGRFIVKMGKCGGKEDTPNLEVL